MRPIDQRYGQIIEMLDSLTSVLDLLRQTIRRELAPDLEMICGEWVRPDSTRTVRIFHTNAGYYLERGNPSGMSGQPRTYTLAIIHENGNMYYGVLHRIVRYDRENDTIYLENEGTYCRKND